MSKKYLYILIIILLIVLSLTFYFLDKDFNILGKYLPFLKSEEKNNENFDKIVLVRESESGKYLTDLEGMTLYTFADDKDMESLCDDDCAKDWPPYYSRYSSIQHTNDPVSKNIKLIKRKPYNILQYSFQMYPLYHYVGDKTPGDTNGNGLGNGKWRIVKILD